MSASAKTEVKVMQARPRVGVNLRIRNALLKDKKIKEILQSCRSVVACMPKVESKRAIPPFKGRDAPTPLAGPDLGYTCDETKESLILRDSFRSLFGDKHYKFRISTALNMSSSGAGIVNSVINVNAIQFAGDFLSLASVFNEFFIVAMEVKWQPVSRYQYPLGGTSTLSVANLPMGKANLQHGSSAYSSLSTLAENFDVGFHNTGDPFTDIWYNTESVKESVLATQTAATQSWCTTGNAANYQGSLQYLSQSAPPALPFSQVLGTFMTHWEVMFRVRY